MGSPEATRDVAAPAAADTVKAYERLRAGALSGVRSAATRGQAHLEHYGLAAWLRHFSVWRPAAPLQPAGVAAAPSAVARDSDLHLHVDLAATAALLADMVLSNLMEATA